MTDKYALIIQCLETPKLSTQIMEECDIKRGTIPTMLLRLLAKNMIKRERVYTEGIAKIHYVYIRLVDSCTKQQVFAKNDGVPIHKKDERIPGSRYIPERHVTSEKKKSPRVYVGCSFGQVGW